jgi:hypothetical protein
VWRGLGWWKAARSYLRDAGYLRDNYVQSLPWHRATGRHRHLSRCEGWRLDGYGF